MLSCKEPGGLFAICSQGNFPIQGSRADAKQMRGKRSSAGSTARDAAQGNPARLSNFRSKSVVLLAEEFLRKGLPKSVALPAEVSKIRPPRRGGFLLAEVSCGAGGGLVRAKGAAAGCAARARAVFPSFGKKIWAAGEGSCA